MKIGMDAAASGLLVGMGRFFTIYFAILAQPCWTRRAATERGGTRKKPTSYLTRVADAGLSGSVDRRLARWPGLEALVHPQVLLGRFAHHLLDRQIHPRGVGVGVGAGDIGQRR